MELAEQNSSQETLRQHSSTQELVIAQLNPALNIPIRCPIGPRASAPHYQRSIAVTAIADERAWTLHVLVACRKTSRSAALLVMPAAQCDDVSTMDSDT